MKHFPLMIAMVALVGCAISISLSKLSTDTSSTKQSEPLWKAARDGDVETAKQLLADGADANAEDGWSKGTALHNAAYDGRKEITTLLIINGANVNAINTFNETALHISVFAGHLEHSKILKPTTPM